MIYYIYKITLLKGSLAGKYYIGQHRTKNINDGYAGSGTILRNYYKAYGKKSGETFIKEILRYCSSIQELNKVEKELIADRYDSDDNCINLIAGGRGKGYSKETRKKISEANNGREISQKTRESISKTLMGHSISPETKDKIRESVRRKCEEPGYRKKLSDAQKKRPPISDETRKKISESSKGRKGCWAGKTMPKSMRDKMSNSQKGYFVINNGVDIKKVREDVLSEYLKNGWIRGYTKEHKMKLSDSNPMKGKHLSEEKKKALSEKIKGRKLPEWSREKIAANNRARANDPEIRRKISEAKKGKHLSPEHIAKVAAAKRGIPQSPESNKKRSEALKGCHWYFDEQLNKRVYVLQRD